MLLTLLTCLVGLAALNGWPVIAAAAQEIIQDDSYFFGQSPPVYPSPEMSGAGDWADAYAKASELVSGMTLEEKVNITGGISSGIPGDAGPSGCEGTVGGVPRLGFPGMCLCDAGQGMRNTDFVNAYPSGIHVGASWNKELARERARAMGAEFKTKGANVLLGPAIGPLGRVQRGGRNWEGFSIDPYLSGRLVSETVSGIQEAGVIATAKHFIANEQETHRKGHDIKMDNVTGYRHAVSSNVDDRTMHELYLWPFQDAIKAGAGSVMCSYNRVNNSYGCANSKTQNGLLKTELGFQGFIVSDWEAQHAGVATALSGLDMAMPNGGAFWGAKLVEAVNNGSVPEARVTDMATRILAAWFKMNQDTDFPEIGIGKTSDMSQPHPIIDARTESAKPILFSGAVEGHVLVKNENNILPLKSPRLLSLFGYSATSPNLMNQNGGGFADPFVYGAHVVPFEELLQGVLDNTGYNFSAAARGGTIISGGGAGATTPSLLVSPFEALKTKAAELGTALFWDFTRSDPHANSASDACIVFGNAWAMETYDRPALTDEFTDELVNNVASQCSNTIVVLHNAGIRLVDAWIEHPNVTSVLFAHLPGQDSGPALVSILFGDANPSGKLPYTVAKQPQDYGPTLNPSLAKEDEYTLFPQSDFLEGTNLDYHHFSTQKETPTPRFPFGYGLSYTTFSYTSLRITSHTSSSLSTYPTGQLLPGGVQDLWTTLVTVSFTLKNSGSLTGAEVSQLYLSIPDSPDKKQLRGFEKKKLEKDEETVIKFDLTRRDLSFWDVESQMWRLGKGMYGVFVGGSSVDLPLWGFFDVEEDGIFV